MGIKGYVIKDEEGNFVSEDALVQTDDEWVYSYFTGVATGFSWYNNIVLVEKSLIDLQKLSSKHRLNKKFNIEYINNIKAIQKGKFKTQNIPLLTDEKLVING